MSKFIELLVSNDLSTYLQACQPPSAISVRIALRIRHEPRPKILNVAVKYTLEQRKKIGLYQIFMCIIIMTLLT